MPRTSDYVRPLSRTCDENEHDHAGAEYLRFAFFWKMFVSFSSMLLSSLFFGDALRLFFRGEQSAVSDQNIQKNLVREERYQTEKKRILRSTNTEPIATDIALRTGITEVSLRGNVPKFQPSSRKCEEWSPQRWRIEATSPLPACVKRNMIAIFELHNTAIFNRHSSVYPLIPRPIHVSCSGLRPNFRRQQPIVTMWFVVKRSSKFFDVFS